MLILFKTIDNKVCYIRKKREIVICIAKLELLQWWHLGINCLNNINSIKKYCYVKTAYIIETIDILEKM